MWRAEVLLDLKILCVFPCVDVAGPSGGLRGCIACSSTVALRGEVYFRRLENFA